MRNIIFTYSRDRRDVTGLLTQVNKCTVVNWPVNFYITGNGENYEKRVVFIQILRFLHQSAHISKENHCLLSLHDGFDYNSSDFSQIIEKKLGCGWCCINDRLIYNRRSIENFF